MSAESRSPFPKVWYWRKTKTGSAMDKVPAELIANNRARRTVRFFDTRSDKYVTRLVNPENLEPREETQS